MRVGIRKFLITAALAILVLMAGSATSWAACPTSPDYTPDFSSEPTPPQCLTFNSFAAFGPPASSLPQPPGTPNPAQPAPAGVTKVIRLTTNSTSETGSAWFNTQQTVTGSFSTTFTFQISDTTNYVADGFAFLIQNSPQGTGALDPDNGADGCSLGFGQITSGNCTAFTGGIPNSIAVAFDTYQNPDINDPSGNDIEIQSCGVNPNTVDATCRIANNPNPLDPNGNPINLADGYVHTVTVTFTPSGACTNVSCPGVLDVILDSADQFPAVAGENPQPEGVPFDMASIGVTNTNGQAFVGFTGATGGGDDNHDILSWTFSPGSQSAAVNTNTPAVVNFNGGTQNNAYDYNALLTSGGITSGTATINPILMSQQACNKLVQKSFPLTQCFVYKNAGIVNGQSVDASVLFELTCPDQPAGTCGTPQTPDFFAQLGSDFTFTLPENPGFLLLASTIGPYPGWLKGVGPNPLHPCAPFQNNWPALFQSNQIESFSYSLDPGGKTKGGSLGSGSCWLATYFTSGELPPGVKITSPKFTTYARNSVVPATYACSTPVTSKDVTNPSNVTGPYLTVASCSQSQLPNKNNSPATCSSPTFAGGISCTGGGVDTSTPGLHLFTVTGVDSGGNVNVNTVLYNVK